MEIKRTYQFGLQPQKSTVAPYFYIRMRLTYDKNHLDINTKCSVMDVLAWDAEKNQVRRGYLSRKGVGYKEQNNTIALCRKALEDSFKYFEVAEVIPTPKQLRAEYERRMGAVQDACDSRPLKSFWEAFDEYTTVYAQENSWSRNTSIQFAVLKNILHGYKRKIAFEDLTENWLTGLLVYLRDEKETIPSKAKPDEDGNLPEGKVGLMNRTIAKKFGFLKMFLNWATRKGYNTNTAYQNFKPKLKTLPRKVIYLTEEERGKLRDCKIPPEKKYLERVRDVFLFCCFSGLRHSDVYNLKKADIKNGKMHITTIKTADNLEIELNTTTQAILDKYKDLPIPDGRALPVVSDQNMNIMLKELCKLAGIDEPVTMVNYKGSVRSETTLPKYQWITTHAGRRTFIVMCLSAGIPATTVMKWTGHSSYTAMKPYIDIVDKSKEESMRRLNSLK